MIEPGLLRWGIVLLGLIPNGSGTPPPVPQNNNSVDDLYLFEGVHNNSAQPGTLHRLLRLSLKSRFVNQHQISQRDIGDTGFAWMQRLPSATKLLNWHPRPYKKMTMFMPVAIFQRLASVATVGIFTKAETMSVYPEYYAQANPPECCTQDNVCCSGTCSSSCTFDGRKWFRTAGAGGRRTVIIDDNILCNAADPYGGSANILVHEFAHTVHLYGLDSALTNRIISAYSNAQSQNLWSDQYAMVNAKEYFAVGTSVFFNADHRREGNSGPHMTICGSSVCSTENAGKNNLYHRDVTLYGIILEVFSGGANHDFNIGPCTH